MRRVCDPRGIVQLLCPFAARSGNALAALEDATHEVVSIISLRPSEWRPWRILHDSSEEMAANELVMAAATSDDVETLERVLDSASEGVARRRILRAHHSSPEMMSLTALGAAAEVGHFRAADFLLRQGAPIHARDSRGRTALHNAADGGRLAVIEVLLSAGADRLLRDRDGKLPRDLAQAAQHHAAALRLRDVPSPDVLEVLVLGREAPALEVTRARDRELLERAEHAVDDPGGGGPPLAPGALDVVGGARLPRAMLPPDSLGHVHVLPALDALHERRRVIDLGGARLGTVLGGGHDPPRRAPLCPLSEGAEKR